MSTVLKGASVLDKAPVRCALRKILYASDFSSPSEAAFPYALGLARTYEAELIIFHALPPAPFDLQGGFVITPDELLKSAAEELKRFGRCAGNVRHRLILREGEVWPALDDLIDQENVDLLVLGTHGRTGPGRLILGSVAEEILRRATCPVLTVGPNASPRTGKTSKSGLGIRCLLYAVDFSAESLAAAALALSMAQENQAKLALLHVLEETSRDYRKDPERVLTFLRGELAKIVPEEARVWCQPECIIEFGAAAERILEASALVSADMIVMGVRSPGDHLFAATHFPHSAAHAVIVGAKCPVLTVLG